MSAILSPQQTYYSALSRQLPEPSRKLDWTFSGFGSWVRKEMKGAEQEEEAQQLGFFPDGYALDKPRRFAYLLEIVETNDIDDDKAHSISSCFWLLDEVYWQLSVVLFYPKYARTMLVDPLFLDGYATKFKGRKQPYRDAFIALRRDITAWREEDAVSPPTATTESRISP